MANSIALAGLYRHLYFGSTKRLDATAHNTRSADAVKADRPAAGRHLNSSTAV